MQRGKKKASQEGKEEEEDWGLRGISRKTREFRARDHRLFEFYGRTNAASIKMERTLCFPRFL
jgi:hypothetical protein